MSVDSQTQEARNMVGGKKEILGLVSEMQDVRMDKLKEGNKHRKCDSFQSMVTVYELEQISRWLFSGLGGKVLQTTGDFALWWEGNPRKLLRTGIA